MNKGTAVITDSPDMLLRRFIEGVWMKSPKVARQAILDLKGAGDKEAAAIWERFTTVDVDINDRLEARGLRRPDGDFSTIPRFADFAPLLSGDFKPEVPSIAEAMPGKHLLYAGRINEQHGEPATGKTNIALIFCILEIAAGRTVVYLDPEDNHVGIWRKLMAFGADPQHVIERFKYCQNPQPEEYLTLHVWADLNRPSLVVLDGLAEALASDGFDEDKAGDFLTFCKRRLVPFTANGAAVLVSDHVTKSSDGRGRWSRGTGAKVGRYDGVSFELVLKRPYSPKVAGCVELKISKDRNGGVGRLGEVAAVLDFKPGDNGRTMFSFGEKPAGAAVEPTWYMEAVSKFLESSPGAGQKEVRHGVGKKAEHVDRALDALEAKGYLRVTRQSGKRTVFEVLTPYRQEEQ